MFTSQKLINHIVKDDELYRPTEYDYGFVGLGKEEYEQLLGIYRELICDQGVSHMLLHRCLVSDRLDDLIITKYGGPYPNIKYFHNKKCKNHDQMCEEWIMPDKSPKIDWKVEEKEIIENIESQLVEKSIPAKPDEILKVLEYQTYNCFICDDKLLTKEWKEGCQYSFEIENPHGNVIYVSCRYCSTRERTSKVCENCDEHNMERVLPKKEHIIRLYSQRDGVEDIKNFRPTNYNMNLLCDGDECPHYSL